MGKQAPVTTANQKKKSVAQTVKAPEEPQTALMELAVGAPPARGYIPRSAPETRLTPRQGLALKALLSSCVKAKAYCEMERYEDLGGRVVEQNGHSVRYLLDSYADAWESAHDVKLLDIDDMYYESLV